MTQPDSLSDSDDVGLGHAVMLLRGAVDRFDTLNTSNLDSVISEISYAVKVINIYTNSKNIAPKDSLVTEKYIRHGDHIENILRQEISFAHEIIKNKINAFVEKTLNIQIIKE